MDDFETGSPVSERRMTFRPLSPNDYPLMLKWLLAAHVREWWDEGEHTLEKVREAYGPEEGVSRYIIEMPDETGSPVPVGYIQRYEEGDGSFGIDIFIGEQDWTGKGVGSRAVRKMAELTFDESGAERIIIDPHPDNLRAIRCYEKAGFRHFRDVADRDGAPAYMMELGRDGGTGT